MSGTPRKADYAWAVLARVLSFGKDRTRIKTNVCERGGRLYTAQRQEKIWTADHIARFMSAAPHELQVALVLALWTGQRQGDLLRLQWGAFADGRLRVFQAKGKKSVTIPVGPTLSGWLLATPKRTITILTGQRGNPWTSDGFRTEWRKVCEKVGISDVTFHDLRGTAVTRLALAGFQGSGVTFVVTVITVRTRCHVRFCHGDEWLVRAAGSKLVRFSKPPPSASRPRLRSGASVYARGMLH
jgi:integrase